MYVGAEICHHTLDLNAMIGYHVGQGHKNRLAEGALFFIFKNEIYHENWLICTSLHEVSKNAYIFI